MHYLAASADFVNRWATTGEIDRYVRATGPSSATRLGVISNPMARTNWRTRGHERLRRLLPAPEDAVSTPSIRDMSWALDYLLLQRGCNVLGINGGDGTIHLVIQGLSQLTKEASARLGRVVPMPILLFLNGGGMNMVARVVATRSDPCHTVRRFVHAHAGRPLALLSTRRLGLLEVRDGTEVPRLGFVFGSQLVRNALTMYERLGQGYVGLARLLLRAGAGAWLETRDWTENRHLLTPPEGPLLVDGERICPYALAVVSTIPLSIFRGVICAVPRLSPVGEMSGLVIETDAPKEIVRLIPSMMSAAQVPGIRPLRGVRTLELLGAYALDGERLGSSDTRRIQVSATDRSVFAVCVSGQGGGQGKVARGQDAS